MASRTKRNPWHNTIRHAQNPATSDHDPRADGHGERRRASLTARECSGDLDSLVTQFDLHAKVAADCLDVLAQGVNLRAFDVAMLNP